MDDNIDFKCYNCGKKFRDINDLERHKKRKTPCLIREVSPENRANPNRCIYCNSIFAKQSNLTRHLTSCKIKNGGMEILADKVRYDQEIRILKEQREIDKRENAAAVEKAVGKAVALEDALEKQKLEFQVQIAELKKQMKKRLVQTAMEIIPLIWFNADHKENLSTYLVNKGTGETLAYDGITWKVVPVDTLKKDLRNRAYEITSELITADMLNEFTKYIPAQIKSNQIDAEVIEIEEDTVYNRILENRELVKQMTPSANGKK